MLNKVKAALRLTTNIYDAEIQSLINAAYADLGIMRISPMKMASPLVTMAVITYCRMHFGSPNDYDRLKVSYDEQKAQLSTARGYGL